MFPPLCSARGAVESHYGKCKVEAEYWDFQIGSFKATPRTFFEDEGIGRGSEDRIGRSHFYQRQCASDFNRQQMMVMQEDGFIWHTVAPDYSNECQSDKGQQLMTINDNSDWWRWRLSITTVIKRDGSTESDHYHWWMIIQVYQMRTR